MLSCLWYSEMTFETFVGKDKTKSNFMNRLVHA